MKLLQTAALAGAALLAAGPSVVHAEVVVKHFAAPAAPGRPAPTWSRAVMAGDTLYISGAVDVMDPATGKPPADAKAGAKVVMDSVKRTVEEAGLTMDDLVWVQVFAPNRADYDDFNTVYRGYFTGPPPARAFTGAAWVLGAHFEVIAQAVRRKPD
jgi:2-iminobutanoate/2-iminopropanoate deaminase